MELRESILRADGKIPRTFICDFTFSRRLGILLNAIEYRGKILNFKDLEVNKEKIEVKETSFTILWDCLKVLVCDG